MPEAFDEEIIIKPRPNQRGNKFYLRILCPLCKQRRLIHLKSLKALKRGEYSNRLCGHCQAIKNLGDNIQPKIGRDNRFWKRGWLISRGYKRVKIYPDNPYFCMADRAGYVAEHRLIMAQSLGRPLTHSEIVHHKDGVKLHNSKENLELLTAKGHLAPNLVAEMMPRLEARVTEVEKQNRLLKWEIRMLKETRYASRF